MRENVSAPRIYKETSEHVQYEIHQRLGPVARAMEPKYIVLQPPGIVDIVMVKGWAIVAMSGSVMDGELDNTVSVVSTERITELNHLVRDKVFSQVWYVEIYEDCCWLFDAVRGWKDITFRRELAEIEKKYGTRIR
jgi:hypothetical protein